MRSCLAGRSPVETNVTPATEGGQSCRFLQFPGYTPLRIVIYTAYRFPRRSISRVARMALGMV